MPKLFHLAIAAVAIVLLGGCCRDTVREMASLKDMRGEQVRRHAVVPSERKTQRVDKASREDDDDDDEERIETGSVDKPTCQGQHLAYQATKEYLKNFGPRPPDRPGERGPCNPGAQ